VPRYKRSKNSTSEDKSGMCAPKIVAKFKIYGMIKSNLPSTSVLSNLIDQKTSN
jgi:hypothetical protein